MVLTPGRVNPTAYRLRLGHGVIQNPIPSQQIVGVTDGSNAASGFIGEYITSGPVSGVALSNGVAATAASITLTAGDWDISANLELAPAGTTTVAGLFGCISSVTNALTPAEGGSGFTVLFCSFTTGLDIFLPIAPCRVNITTPTTYYLVTEVFFSVSTMTGGGIIKARRVR